MHPTENNDRPENENEPQPPQNRNWIRFALPGLFTLLFIAWALTARGGTGTNGAEIPISYVRDNYTQLEYLRFQSEGSQVTGSFNGAITLNIDGETIQIDDFSSYAIESQQEDLNTLINTHNAAIGNGEIQGNRIEVTTTAPEIPILAILINILPFILIVGFIIFMMRRAQGQVNGVFNFGQSRAKEYDAQMPRITFDDVAGQDAAKRELVEVVDFLKEPEKYISLGARIPRGVLLIGPPGTGKTLMARAVAGEANVAFYSISASEFVEMFVGVGASRVRDLFKKAKDNSPSIVFIDEIDAVGRQRGAGLGGGNDEREQTLNQMLSELDGFDQSSTVIVMAATNRPDVLDPALLRPGRFDRQVAVGLPDKNGRLDILKIHTRGKPLAKDVDLVTLSNATIGFSGADLANLANEAALHAARHNRKKITGPDFTNAFERIILGIERPPLSDPEERRIVAYHEAGHTVAALLTPGADQVLKVTITPRGFSGGVTLPIRGEKQRGLQPRSYFEADIRMTLGGRAAEEIIFGQITPGAAGDIRQVTQIARQMVTQWGMSSLGMIDYSNGGEQPFLGYSLSQGRQYSEETAAKIDTEVRQIIDEAYKDVYELLSNNQDKLDAIAEGLLEHEVLEREEILERMGMSVDKPIDSPMDALDDVEIEDIMENQDDIATVPDPFALFTDDTVPDIEGDLEETEPDTVFPPDSPDDGDQPGQE